MAVGYLYQYILEPQENGWWLVRFPETPEALTEGEARASAAGCLIAALEGYMKAGRPVARPSPPDPTSDHVVLPPQVTAKLAVYGTM